MSPLRISAPVSIGGTTLPVIVEIAGPARDDAEFRTMLEAFLGFRRFGGVERVVDEVAALVLGLRPAVEIVEVGLAVETVPAGRVQVRRGEHPPTWEEATFGAVEILHEHDEAGLYLLHIGQGAHIPWHVHRRMRELEFRVSGELLRSGARMRGPEPMSWPLDHPHRYDNVGVGPAVVFACDEPRFRRDDEIEVSAP